MNEMTEHIFPTIGRNIEHYSCPVIAGTAREEIIRCRDCKYSKRYWNREKPLCRRLLPVFSFYVDPDGFCAWGERRDD